jgi:hypothetical protein
MLSGTWAADAVAAFIGLPFLFVFKRLGAIGRSTAGATYRQRNLAARYLFFAGAVATSLAFARQAPAWTVPPLPRFETAYVDGRLIPTDPEPAAGGVYRLPPPRRLLGPGSGLAAPPFEARTTIAPFLDRQYLSLEFRCRRTPDRIELRFAPAGLAAFYDAPLPLRAESDAVVADLIAPPAEFKLEFTTATGFAAPLYLTAVYRRPFLPLINAEGAPAADGYFAERVTVALRPVPDAR